MKKKNSHVHVEMTMRNSQLEKYCNKFSEIDLYWKLKILVQYYSLTSLRYTCA